MAECEAPPPTFTISYTASSKLDVFFDNFIPSATAETYDSSTSAGTIEFSSAVTEIGDRTFTYKTALRNIVLPESVTFIEEGSFENTNNLISITCLATTPPTIERFTFDYSNNCTIYVPSESVSAYKAAENWSDYESRIQAISS